MDFRAKIYFLKLQDEYQSVLETVEKAHQRNAMFKEFSQQGIDEIQKSKNELTQQAADL